LLFVPSPWFLYRSFSGEKNLRRCAHLSDSHAYMCIRVPFVIVTCNYGRKVYTCARVLRVFTHKIYIRALYSRTYKQNQLFDLRDENNPTTSSDSRMRSGEHRSHRGSQGMLQYTRDGTSRSYTRSPVRLLPSDPCYCCDLMKCYARSPAITFPLHRLTPHSVGLVSRSGTLGHLSSSTIPGAAASVGDFVPC